MLIGTKAAECQDLQKLLKPSFAEAFLLLLLMAVAQRCNVRRCSQVSPSFCREGSSKIFISLLDGKAAEKNRLNGTTIAPLLAPKAAQEVQPIVGLQLDCLS